MDNLLRLGTEYGQHVRFGEILSGMRLRECEGKTGVSNLEKVPVFQTHRDTEFNY